MPLHRLLIALLSILSIALLPSLAVSQTCVTPTSTQGALWQQGVKETKGGDYKSATGSLKAALKPEPIDLVYLSLGRALSKAGQCKEAKAAFDKVIKAPGLCDPTAKQDKPFVKAKLKQFEAEMPQLCPGTLTVTCKPETMKVQIDDKPPVACSKLSGELMPAGKYTLVGLDSKGKKTDPYEINIIGQGESKVTLNLGKEIVNNNNNNNNPGPTPPGKTDTEGSSLGSTGWVLFGLGAAAGLTSIALDLAVIGPIVEDLEECARLGDQACFDDKEEELDTMQTVNKIVMFSGVGLAVIGLTLVIIDAATADDTAASADDVDHLVSPWLGPNSAGAAWTVRW